MRFQVMSKTAAKNYCGFSHNERSIIISINNVWSEPVVFRNKVNKVYDILFTFFDDVEKGDTNCITPKIGKEIADFVNKWKDKIDLIIVHCEAGRSRSAGVCAAIMCALTGNDWDIFSNPMYVPNMTCYRTVLNGFFNNGGISVFEQQLYQEQEKDKLDFNIRVWKEANDI